MSRERISQVRPAEVGALPAQDRRPGTLGPLKTAAVLLVALPVAATALGPRMSRESRRQDSGEPKGEEAQTLRLKLAT